MTPAELTGASLAIQRLAIQRLDGALRRIDRVVLATLALFAALLALAPTQAYDSLVFTLDSIVFIAPFLVVSVVVAASVKATGLDRQIAVVFSGRQAPVIVAAAVFGALSPVASGFAFPSLPCRPQAARRPGCRWRRPPRAGARRRRRPA